VLGNTSIIMASSGKRNEGKGGEGGEASRGVFPRSRVFVIYFIVLLILLTF